MDELKRVIDSSIAAHNQNPKPFVRAATADLILYRVTTLYKRTHCVHLETQQTQGRRHEPFHKTFRTPFRTANPIPAPFKKHGPRSAPVSTPTNRDAIFAHVPLKEAGHC